MFRFYGLQEVDRVTLSNNMERAKTASSTFTAG